MVATEINSRTIQGTQTASHLGPQGLALAIGLIAFLVLFGPGFLFNQSPYLTAPLGDVAGEMGGYFRTMQDGWRFPLFDLPTANEPEGANQLFMGGVPLLALFAKFVRSLTGANLNLFGFWYFLCVVLQAHSFYFLMRQVTDRRPYLAAIASVAGVLAYAFVTRFGHASLFGQFVNIYAMAFVVATTRSDANTDRVMAWLAGLSFLAMFIFAYLAIANVVLFCAGLLSLWWLGRISLRRASIYLLAFGATLLLLAWIGGYFWGTGRAEPMPMISYGVYGFNVGSLVIPHQSFLFPNQPTLSGWWEGDFYLGAGIVALWALFLLFGLNTIAAPLVRNWPLALLLFFFAILSASNHVNFGATTIFTYPLPQFVAPVIGMARVGGRLFWPIGYLLIAAPMALTIQRYPKQASTAIVAVALVSVIEASGSYAFLKSRISTVEPVAVNYDGLKSVIAQHKAVRIYPSYWCDTEPGQFRRLFHWQVEYSSAVANVESNSATLARKVKDCDREAKNIRALQPDEISIFLSSRAARASLASSKEDPSQVCRSFKLDATEALMCSSGWRRDSFVPIPELKNVNSASPELQVNDKIDFGSQGNRTSFLNEGWWRDSDPTFTWTDGATSSISFTLLGAPSPDLYLTVKLLPFLHPPEITSRSVEVLVNGEHIGSWALNSGDWQDRNIDIPADLRSKNITITFRQNEIRSPNDFGAKSDPRHLGIAVKAMVLRSR